jgi:type IV pilus assembly protein PilE
MRGFTLLELMIAVTITGLLATYAVSSYRQYIVQSYIHDATSVLTSLSAQIERNYLDTRTYGDGNNNCNVVIPGPDTFTFSCALNDDQGQSYTLTAVSNNKFGLGAGAYEFTLDNTGARSTVAFAGSDMAADCWIARESGTCL